MEGPSSSSILSTLHFEISILIMKFRQHPSSSPLTAFVRVAVVIVVGANIVKVVKGGGGGGGVVVVVVVVVVVLAVV